MTGGARGVVPALRPSSSFTLALAHHLPLSSLRYRFEKIVEGGELKREHRSAPQSEKNEIKRGKIIGGKEVLDGSRTFRGEER